MIMRSIHLILFALIFVAGSCSKRGGGPIADAETTAGPAPDARQIERIGSETLAALENGRAAVWTARFFSKTGAPGFDVDVVRCGTNVSWRFLLAASRTNGYLQRVVQTNGLWFVWEQTNTSRWLPYQARLGLIASYALLAGSEPISATKETLDQARFVKSKNSNALYTIELSGGERKALESVLKQTKQAAREMTGDNLVEMKRTIQTLESKLEGIPIVVNEKFGIIRERQFYQGSVRIINFGWLDETTLADWKPFDLKKDELPIQDHTQPITDWDLERCVLVMHDPAHLKDRELPPSPDPYVLNLVSGEVRRVPFRGGTALSARFLKDRRKVAITSMDPELRDVITIDLQTGENQSAGGGQMGRMGFLTELSPDGKRLGLMEMAFDRSLLLQQPRSLDLEEHIASDIGKPLEAFGQFSWLPDGNGIVLIRATGGTKMSDVQVRMIAKMGLNGSIKDLGEGNDPIVLRKSQRILYRTVEGEASHWMTMDLNGGGKKLFGDGLTNFVFAAVSPDESKVFFEKRVGERELHPYLFEVNGGEPKRVTNVEGYFGPSAWR
jgi:hypothetical protein